MPCTNRASVPIGTNRGGRLGVFHSQEGPARDRGLRSQRNRQELAGLTVNFNFSFNDFLVTFMSIIFEALPFIVLGSLISGMLEEFLPQQFFARWLPKNRVLAIMGSSLMGMLLPMCECGIVPVMRRLLRKGVPASCAVTYMLSAPVINPIVLTSTALAFWAPQYTITVLGVELPGVGMVLLRGGLAFVTAVTVGLVFERLTRKGVSVVREGVSRDRLIETDESLRLLDEDQDLTAAAAAKEHAHEHDHGHHEHDHDHDHGHTHDHDHGVARTKPRSLLDRLSAVADIGLSDFLDIAAFLIIGSALAAAVNTALSRDQLETLSSNETFSVVVMMGLAVVLSLCSEADAFVAANFTSFSTGSKLAFLVLGPMFDVKLYIMYQWVFTKRAVWTLITLLLTLIVCLSIGVDVIAALLSPEVVASAEAASAGS